VIQAHYEHPHFIVRKTDHFVFEEGSTQAFKLMLRWMLNTPTELPRCLKDPAKHGIGHKLSSFSSLLANTITKTRESGRIRTNPHGNEGHSGDQKSSPEARK